MSSAKTPVCTKEGVIFDILNIMPYVRKHKKNPVTGESLAPKDLVRLNIAKNGDGKWHCPVTFKVRRHTVHADGPSDWSGEPPGYGSREDTEGGRHSGF